MTGTVAWKRLAIQKGMATVLKYLRLSHIHIVQIIVLPQEETGRWGILRRNRLSIIIWRCFLRSRAA